MGHKILTSSIDGIRSHFKTSYSLTVTLLEKKTIQECRVRHNTHTILTILLSLYIHSLYIHSLYYTHYIYTKYTIHTITMYYTHQTLYAF